MPAELDVHVDAEVVDDGPLWMDIILVLHQHRHSVVIGERHRRRGVNDLAPGGVMGRVVDHREEGDLRDSQNSACERDRETEREIDRQTDRQTDRERDSQSSPRGRTLGNR